MSRESPPEPPIKSLDEMLALMREARRSGKVAIARKTRPVDVRPAVPGEVVVTVVAGEGEESRSKPAAAGDWVVRNRSPKTGDEQYLVQAAKFASRYDEPSAEPDAEGWREVRPRAAQPVRFFRLEEDLGEIRFMAPWGEPMVARPGDAIVQDLAEERDLYRVAAQAFTATYEVLGPEE